MIERAIERLRFLETNQDDPEQHVFIEAEVKCLDGVERTIQIAFDSKNRKTVKVSHLPYSDVPIGLKRYYDEDGCLHKVPLNVAAKVLNSILENYELMLRAG